MGHVHARGDELMFQILATVDGRLIPKTLEPGPQQSVVLGGHWRLARERNRAGHFTCTLGRSD